MSLTLRPTEKDLHETYLPAFEMLVKDAGVEAIMGAYNRVDGEPSCGSDKLLEHPPGRVGISGACGLRLLGSTGFP